MRFWCLVDSFDSGRRDNTMLHYISIGVEGNHGFLVPCVLNLVDKV